jgi:hypothetical protein
MANLQHAEAFRQFHAENPHIYEALERMAFKLRNKGMERWGIKALWEVLRYELAIATNSPVTTFRLNNNMTAYYARLLMERNPEDLAGFFETRERHGAKGLDAGAQADLP